MLFQAGYLCKAIYAGLNNRLSAMQHVAPPFNSSGRGGKISQPFSKFRDDIMPLRVRSCIYARDVADLLIVALPR